MTRTLWNGQYKPYYEITFLNDINPDARMSEDEVTKLWWAFLDDIETLRS